MSTLEHYPLVTVRNEKLEIEYTLMPKVWGFNKKTLKDSLNPDKAELRIDVHLGLEGIEKNSDLIVSVNDYGKCVKHNDGLLTAKYDRDSDNWSISTGTDIKRISESKGYEIKIEKVYTGKEEK